MDRVLDYYDGPILFTVRDELRRAYLAMSVEDTPTSGIYLYAPISDLRLAAVLRGRVSLREAFRELEQENAKLALVDVPFAESDETTARLVSVDQVPDDYFTDPDEFLTENRPPRRVGGERDRLT